MIGERANEKTEKNSRESEVSVEERDIHCLEDFSREVETHLQQCLFPKEHHERPQSSRFTWQWVPSVTGTGTIYAQEHKHTKVRQFLLFLNTLIRRANYTEIDVSQNGSYEKKMNKNIRSKEKKFKNVHNSWS